MKSYLPIFILVVVSSNILSNEIDNAPIEFGSNYKQELEFAYQNQGPAKRYFVCLQRNPSNHRKSVLFLGSIYMQLLVGMPIIYQGPVYKTEINFPATSHRYLERKFNYRHIKHDMLLATKLEEPAYYYVLTASKSAHYQETTYTFKMGDFHIQVSGLNRLDLWKALVLKPYRGRPSFGSIISKVRISPVKMERSQYMVCKSITSRNWRWFSPIFNTLRFEAWTQSKRVYTYDDEWVPGENKGKC
eukprot:GAHX01001600.1.p1 GENE.GAHX01001600.1~~GAHX01001600.1.p1  ORF type:complete len:252 (-),score=15.15 GAHX01001600.1:20-754(-)